MLRVKIPVGSTRLEAEGDNEAELETAVRVALRVAENWTVASAPQNQSDSRHADEEERIEVEVATPLRGEPDTPIEPEQTKVPIQQKRTKGLPPPGYTSPNYEGLGKREQLCLAVCDLNVNFDEREPSANRVLEHLEKTGGKFKSRGVDLASIARQAMRTYEGTISTGKGWRGTEEAIRDFVARGLLWVQDKQALLEPKHPKVEDRDEIEDEANVNSEVSHAPFDSSSFNGLRS